MANYSDFITLLRSEVGDFPVRRFESADGDAATTLFNLQHPKFLESTMVIKISGATQSSSLYDLFPNVAQVIFDSAPASGNDNVTFEYQSVNETDADWIEIINDVLKMLRGKLWIEFVNESALDTVANQNDYALSSIAADVVHVLNVEYRLSSSEDWQDIRNAGTNVAFYRDLQKLHFRPYLATSGYDIRVRGNRFYVLGDESSDTLELQTKYYTVVKEYCKARYLERRAAAMLAKTGAESKEASFESVGEITKLAKMAKDSADEMLKAVKPPKPAVAIPTIIGGINI